MTYKMPDNLVKPHDRYDVATNMAFFLIANGLKIFDIWVGKMKAADQRKIFGIKLGKGLIRIDGDKDRAACSVTVCFGTMREDNVWIDCQKGIIGKNFFTPHENNPHEIEINEAKKWFYGI